MSEPLDRTPAPADPRFEQSLAALLDPNREPFEHEPEPPARGVDAFQAAHERAAGHSCAPPRQYPGAFLIGLIGADGVACYGEVRHPMNPTCVIGELSKDSSVQGAQIVGMIE